MRLDDNVKDFLLKTLGSAFPRSGGIQSCCPFHSEKSPSFFIYFDGRHKNQWWFKCHGCELNGSLNTLLRRINGHAFVTTERLLEKREYQYEERIAHFDDTFGYPEEYSYYESRGISARIAKYFGFRFDYGGPAAVMPVYTEEQYMGNVRRNLDPSMPRYILSAGMDLSKVLWGLDSVDRRKSTFITEGIIDAACLWSQGHQAVSLVVKGSYEHKLELLSKLKKPILIPDNDFAGLKTFSEMAKTLSAQVVLVPRKHKDISEWVASGKFML